MFRADLDPNSRIDDRLKQHLIGQDAHPNQIFTPRLAVWALA